MEKKKETENKETENKDADLSMSKMTACVVGSIGLLMYSEIQVPSFITSVFTSLSNLSMPQIIVGTLVAFGTGIKVTETVQDIIDRNYKGGNK